MSPIADDRRPGAARAAAHVALAARSGRERALLVLVVVALTLTPALLSAARSDGVSARTVLAAETPPVAGGRSLETYVSDLMREPLIALSIAGALESNPTEARGPLADARATALGGRHVAIDVSAPSRADARRLVTAVAAAVARASTAGAASRRSSAKRAEQLRRELGTSKVTDRRRAAAAAELKFIEAAMGSMSDDVALHVVGAGADPAATTVDRGLRSVLGARADRRPSPLWAGFAGFLTAIGLCVGWLALRTGPRARAQ